jgi:hypothetical protein
VRMSWSPRSFVAALAHPKWFAFLAYPSGYDRQRTAMCPDGGRAREPTRNSQPSYSSGLEAGALGTLISGGFFRAGTSRSPFRTIPVEGSPPDPVVAIDISSPKMMTEKQGSATGGKNSHYHGLLSTHVNKLITPLGGPYRNLRDHS